MSTMKRTSRAIGAAILLAAAVLWADAKSDVSDARRDLDSISSRFDDLKGKSSTYLDESRALRSMDKDQLDQLITQICRLDIEDNDDEPSKLARELTDKVVDRVRREYDSTTEHGGRMVEQLEHIMNDIKSLRDRANNLAGNAEVHDEAIRLRDDAIRVLESIDRQMEKVQTDWKTLDNVKAGVMLGANNPTIRAKMEYGKEKHRELQSSRGCDEKEVVLSSGRPDCIKFDEGACKVIEFKPDSVSQGDAARQAKQYVVDVRHRFRDDPRTKRCKQDSEGPVFDAVGETYSACRAP